METHTWCWAVIKHCGNPQLGRPVSSGRTGVTSSLLSRSSSWTNLSLFPLWIYVFKGRFALTSRTYFIPSPSGEGVPQLHSGATSYLRPPRPPTALTSSPAMLLKAGWASHPHLCHCLSGLLHTLPPASYFLPASSSEIQLMLPAHISTFSSPSGVCSLHQGL